MKRYNYFAIGTKFNYFAPIWPCEMKGWTGHPSIRNIMLREDFDVEREDTFHQRKNFTHRQEGPCSLAKAIAGETKISTKTI